MIAKPTRALLDEWESVLKQEGLSVYDGGHYQQFKIAEYGESTEDYIPAREITSLERLPYPVPIRYMTKEELAALDHRTVTFCPVAYSLAYQPTGEGNGKYERTPEHRRLMSAKQKVAQSNPAIQQRKREIMKAYWASGRMGKRKSTSQPTIEEGK